MQETFLLFYVTFFGIIGDEVCKFFESIYNSKLATFNLIFAFNAVQFLYLKVFEGEMKQDIKLVPLQKDDREQFIKDNQEAFKYGATEEFGVRDEHFEEDGEIISRATIEQSIDEGEAYRIMLNGQQVGGVIVKTEGDKGDLHILFVSPQAHSKGIGYAAWCAIEKMYPQIRVWETVTPYFEKRNIHFYVNRCGFKIVEFYNEHHKDPNSTDSGLDEMFRFEKVMKQRYFALLIRANDKKLSLSNLSLTYQTVTMQAFYASFLGIIREKRVRN